MATAVHKDDLPGHERGVQEVENGVGDILREPSSLEGEVFGQALQVVVAELFRGKDGTGSHSVYLKFRGELQSGKGRDFSQGRLAQVVGGMGKIPPHQTGIQKVHDGTPGVLSLEAFSRIPE